MNQIKHIQNAIDYIENHLETEISIEDVCCVSGFSKYHFYQVFGRFAGMPVFAYVTKRRLLHSLYDMSKGMKIINAALKYGFDTHAGFFKAFKREFGCSPSIYLKLHRVNEPVQFNLKEEMNYMLNNQELKRVLINWTLPKSFEIENALTFGGDQISDRVFFIGDDYVLKTGHNIAEQRVHLDIMKALTDKGFKTALPMLTKDQQEMHIKDGRYYVLTNRITGKFLTPEERYGQHAKDYAFKYGQAIAQLHNVLAPIDLDTDEKDFFEIVKTWALPEAKKAMIQWQCPLPDTFYSNYLESIEPMINQLPKHNIHRDPNPSNILFNKGEVTGFIDFDLTEKNIRIFDPCYCATGILSEAHIMGDQFSKWPSLFQSIIEGYDDLCPLNALEKKALPYVVLGIQMIFIAWLATQDNSKKLAENNRKMLLWLNENKTWY